jgi:hypothetical protein
MKTECIDTRNEGIAARAVETVQPSMAACVEKPHFDADSNLCTDGSCVQRYPETPAETAEATSAPGIWDTVRKAYCRISMLPEAAAGNTIRGPLS